MAVTFVTGTIAAGESLSAAIDARAGELSTIFVPVDWSNANISFQASPDNVEFGDLYDWDGREIIIAGGAGRTIIVNPFASGGTGKPNVAGVYIKIRSGTAAFPLVQVGAVTFTLALQSA